MNPITLELPPQETLIAANLIAYGLLTLPNEWGNAEGNLALLQQVEKWQDAAWYAHYLPERERWELVRDEVRVFSYSSESGALFMLEQARRNFPSHNWAVRKQP